MIYLLTFFEGVITFISPCLLPMLPVYIAYLSGSGGEGGKRKTFVNSLGFVAGFSFVFILLGAFAATLGSFFLSYKCIINIVLGLVVIILGLNYLGLLKIGFLNKIYKLENKESKKRDYNFLSAFLFGTIFSLGWTPCVGAFLGSALVVAAASGHFINGILLLATYSLGLGIPFIISGLIIGSLKGSFDFIKRNYETINKISGILLVVLGILMLTGLLDRLVLVFS